MQTGRKMGKSMNQLNDPSYLNLLTQWMKQNNLDEIDYLPDTPGVFWLNDLNTALTNWRRDGNTGDPVAILIGVHELTHLKACCTSHGPLVPETKKRAKNGSFELFGIPTYPVNSFSCFKTL